MSVKGWPVVSAAVLLACAGAPALAGGFTRISVSSGGYGGLQIGGSYSNWSGGHRGFERGHSGFGFSYRNDYCAPVYVAPCRPVYREYCPPVVYAPRVIYSAPVVYTQPVVYSQPVVYTSPQVIQQPVYQQANYQTASYQPQVVTEPVVTRRVVTEVSQPVVEETVIIKKAPEVIRKVTTIEDTAQRTLTAYEAGFRAIQERKSGEAIDQLNEHLRTNPGDTRALRLTALMYAEQNNCSEAAARMIEAYKADASLVNQPLDAASLGIGAGRMRDITNNAERYAMKFRTGSAYLVTTVLMQAEGRLADAAAMAERAASAGLENGIATGLQTALR